MKITLYQSKQAISEREWLAHMELAPQLYMSFFGSSEQEALSRANSWFEQEQARQKRLGGADNEPSEASIKPANVSSHHFAGKAWVLNRATGHRARLGGAELANALANGYVKAGPRSE